MRNNKITSRKTNNQIIGRWNQVVSASYKEINRGVEG